MSTLIDHHMDVDTGQSNIRNENYKKNDPIPNKELLNLVENQY